MDTKNNKFINDIGKTFNQLTVLGIDEEMSQMKGRTYLRCRCTCGKETTIVASLVTTGVVLSCGCARSNNSFKRHTEVYMNNEKGYGIAFINKKTDNGIDSDYFITFNSEDKNVVMSSSWHIGADGYVAGANRGDYKHPKRILLHRAIVENHEGDIGNNVVDHIDHNKLDLRYENLRSCTLSQNVKNTITDNSGKDNHMKYIWYDKRQELYRVTFKKTKDDVTRKITKSSKSLDEAIAFRDKYIKENEMSDFYYDNNKDNRNKVFNIGFPNDYLHPFYLVDETDMVPPDPWNVICPFEDMNGNDISIRSQSGHNAIQPFEIENPIRFEKGGRKFL